MIRKKLILLIGFVVMSAMSCFADISTTHQQLDEFSFKKGVKASGGLSLTNNFYAGSDSLVNRDPYAFYLNGSLNINLWGISMPFSFSLSNTQKSYTQPFNRFKLDPSYKWVHLLIGTNTLEMSKYTLSDHDFCGVGVELTPDKWNISAMYGRLNKAVEYDPLVANYQTVAFKRMGYAAKVGYAGDFGGEYNVSFFHGEDDETSLSRIPDESYLSPKKNTAISVMVSQKFLKYFFVRAEYAFSVYNSNLFNEDNEPVQTKSFIDKIFKKNPSERYVDAINGSIGYQGNIWGLSFNYERVSPNYSTLGGYYFTNDIENFTFAPNVKLLEGKINISGNVGFQYTNLDGTKTTDTRNNVYSANASFNSGEHWTASLSFSNFNTYTKVKPQAYPYYADALDSLNFYQVSRSASAMTSYNWGGDALKNVVSLTGSYQTANMLSEKKLTSYSDYFSGNLSFSQQVTGLKLGWSSYMMASYTDATNMETVYWGPGVSISKQFFEDKLSTGLSTTYNVNDVSGMTKGALLNTSVNASYSIQPKKKQFGNHTFSLSSGFTRYIGGMVSGDNTYEFLSSLTYRCGF
ncbi:MAG: hypothetical protein U0K66_13595 [Paludibacteraceae bacterium]|nr:hypothetical protein [Paludibacteraceae bacterium]